MHTQPYEPPVLRVRVARPIVLTDDPRSPEDILAATQRDAFPCWEQLLEAWSPRRPRAAETIFASLPIAESRPLVVAHSRSRSPAGDDRAAVARLVAEDDARALVIIVREPAFAPEPALCHIDADSWELALADGFDRVCVRQWIWSCAVPGRAWRAEMAAVSGERGASPEIGDADQALASTLWLAGAVFSGVRSRRSRSR